MSSIRRGTGTMESERTDFKGDARVMTRRARIGMALTLTIGWTAPVSAHHLDAGTSGTHAAARPAATTTHHRTTRRATTRRAAPATTKTVPGGPAIGVAPDSTAEPNGRDLTLKGGAEGTVFRTLTVEGEDRVHLEFDRPELNPPIDPESAPGLEPGGPQDVITRTSTDPMASIGAMAAAETSPYLARPWLGHFASGAVARFHPDVKDVARWRLTVADAHGTEVAAWSGTGAAPREVAWDGRTRAGTVSPGLAFSYAFEAWDRAGNRRTFVGPSFTVSSWRTTTATGGTWVFAGSELAEAPRATAAPVMLEAASDLHQLPKLTSLRVVAQARSADRARALADQVRGALVTLVATDPRHITAEPVTSADAPEAGAVRIEAR